jgi:hypothetical protein
LIDSRQSILFLVSELEYGGEGSSARALAHALPSDQFQINIVVLGRSDVPEVEDLCASGIAVKRTTIRGMMDVGGARRLRRFVRDCEPEIIHAWGAAAVRAARQLVSSDGMGGNYPRLVLSNASKTGGGLRGWLVARRLRRADRVIPSTRSDGDRYRRIGWVGQAVERRAATCQAHQGHAQIGPEGRHATGRIGYQTRARHIRRPHHLAGGIRGARPSE